MLWNAILGLMIAVPIAVFSVKNIADAAERLLRVRISVLDGLMSVRTDSNIILLMLLLPFLLACFYTNREFYYYQFAVRFGSMGSIWNRQTGWLIKLSLFYAFLLTGAVFTASLFETKTLCNWDSADSLYFIYLRRTVSISPVFVIAVVFFSTALVMMIYSEVFLLLIWRISSPIGALLISCGLISADAFLGTQYGFLPEGFLRVSYENIGYAFGYRLLIAAAAAVLLKLLGSRIVNRKEFL